MLALSWGAAQRIASISSKRRECLSRLCAAPNGMLLLLPVDNSHHVFWTSDQTVPGLHKATAAPWIERAVTETAAGRLSKGWNEESMQKQMKERKANGETDPYSAVSMHCVFSPSQADYSPFFYFQLWFRWEEKGRWREESNNNNNKKPIIKVEVGMRCCKPNPGKLGGGNGREQKHRDGVVHDGVTF